MKLPLSRRRLTVLTLLLFALGMADAPVAQAKTDEPVPYPEAKAPDPFPATAPAKDSDCSGMLELPRGPLRRGTWALGSEVSPGSAFVPLLYFNRRRDAEACAGSSNLPVRVWTGTSWLSR